MAQTFWTPGWGWDGGWGWERRAFREGYVHLKVQELISDLIMAYNENSIFPFSMSKAKIIELTLKRKKRKILKTTHEKEKKKEAIL